LPILTGEPAKRKAVGKLDCLAMVHRLIYKKALWLTATAAVATSAVPASAEVYLSESQALGVILGDKAIVRRDQKVLGEALRKRLEHESNLQFPESTYTFFIATQDGKPAKYAIVLNEIGKSEPITFMVGMSPEGKVTEVVIMEFRENRGWEVKEKRFLNQFRNKTVRSAIRVDEDIINYTGATLSSKAIARGVRRSLLLLDAFYPGDSRYKLSAAQDFARPLPLTPITITTNGQETVGLYRQARYAMGTQCEIRLWCRSAEEAHELFSVGFDELGRIEQIFSAYREDSELSHVNRNAGGIEVEVSEEFFRVTEDSLRYSRKSDGSVDITVGPLLKAWGIHRGEGHNQLFTGLQAARQVVGSEKVILDERAKSIRFLLSGMELDFGGIAKGYAAEKIARRMEKLGAYSALVNLGRSSLYASRVKGNMRQQNALSENAERIDQWPVGIAHPDGKNATPFYLFLGTGNALSTSGTSERAFEIEGKSFSHVVNARTGMPLGGTRSATVIDWGGVQTEVLSKELLLLDPVHRATWQKENLRTKWVHLEVTPQGELIENMSGAIKSKRRSGA
jgi:thiamine biosynthesis lipoprotein